MTDPSTIRAVIAPGYQSTRVIVTRAPESLVLAAHLPPSPRHPRALPYFLEALALWEGTTVRAVMAVDEWDASCARSLCHDVLGDCGTPPLYALDWIPFARARRERTGGPEPLRLSDFRDLQRLVLDRRAR